MNFQPVFAKIKEWWQTSDRTQKMVTMLGAAFLVVLVAATIFFSSRTPMEPIFPGATPADQGMVRDAVTALGFKTQISSRGDVLVPSKDLPEIRMKLSQEGKIPASALAGTGSTGVSTEGSFFMTPEEMKKKLQSQQEGELAKSIMSIQGVKSALVHINYGKDSPFGDQKVPPSAVVNLSEQPGVTLSLSEGKAIARLVQNSVPGLDPAHVSVIGATGRMIFDGEEQNSEDAAATKKLEAEREESKRREKDLQKRLDLAFGPSTTLAMVQVELNMDEIQKREESQLTGETPISRESMTEEMKGAPKANQGPAGTAVNIPGNPGAASAQTSPGESYKTETEKAHYPTSSSTTNTVKAPGEVMTMSVNVLVDSNKVQDIAAVEDFLSGLLATHKGRTFSAKVTPTAFSTEAQEAQKKLEEGSVMAQRIQQALSFLPIVALLAIGLMIVKAIGKTAPQPVMASAEAAQAELPEAEALDALPAPERQIIGSEVLAAEDPVYDLSALDGMSLGSIMSTGAQEEGGVEQSHPSGERRQRREEGINGIREIMESQEFNLEEDENTPVHIRGIKEKIDIPLEQIRKLAKDRPETVAVLLKSWIMEEN